MLLWLHDLECTTAKNATKSWHSFTISKYDKIIVTILASQSDVTDVTSTMEVSRLKEEVEVLRNELHRAEVELEDRCWLAPTVLQHWLQLTYELESQTVSDKFSLL